MHEDIRVHSRQLLLHTHNVALQLTNLRSNMFHFVLLRCSKFDQDSPVLLFDKTATPCGCVVTMLINVSCSNCIDENLI